MAIAYQTTIRNNRMKEVSDPGGSTNGIDAGTGAGLLRIYQGTRPASCGAATNKAAELTFSDPAATTVATGLLTMDTISPDTSATGHASAVSWFRAVDSAATCVIDGDVGTTGSDLNLNSLIISAGQEVSVSSFTITEGNA